MLESLVFAATAADVHTVVVAGQTQSINGLAVQERLC